MTKQTILTLEEAEAIEWVKQQIQYKDHPSVFVEAHLKQGGWLGEAKVLTGMHPDTLIRALYVGYEIERPKFEIGQIVVGNSGNKYKITENDGGGFTGINLRSSEIFYLDVNCIRHLTKEEVFWAELGREVGEFRIGDAYKYKDGDVFYVDSDDYIEYAKISYQEGKLEGFHQAEFFKQFPM